MTSDKVSTISMEAFNEPRTDFCLGLSGVAQPPNTTYNSPEPGNRQQTSLLTRRTLDTTGLSTLPSGSCYKRLITTTTTISIHSPSL